MPKKKSKTRKKSTATKGDLDGSPYLSGLAGGSKKEKRTVAEQMRDALRKELKDDGAAMTFGGNGYSAVEEVMPTGLDVIDNWVLSIGGFPYGRVIEISGAEDVGKSSLVNHLMAAAQRDGAIASLGDAERKVQPNWADVFKVKREDILLLPARTVEEYLDELQILLRKYGKRHKMVFILDSVATTEPKEALERDLTENEIPGVMAAAWSRGLRKLNPILSESRSMLILINQLRCVSQNELVITDKGICTAGYAREDSKIAGIGGGLTPIKAHASSRQIAYRILTKDGRSLTCGMNHPVMATARGEPLWVKAKDVHGGDWIAIPRQIELPEVEPSPLPRLAAGDSREAIVPIPAVADAKFCMFLGMWFSDGALLSGRDRALVFTEKSKDRADALIRVADALRWKPSRFGQAGYRFGSRIVRLLESIGCQVGAANKDIPVVITGKTQWRAFLRGMFDSHKVNHGFYLTFENRLAARKVQMALLGFGVYSRAAPSRGGNGMYLYISGTDALRYIEEIGFVEKEKEERIREAVGVPDESSRGKPDIIPGVRFQLQARMGEDGGRAVDPATRQRLWAIFRDELNVSARDYRTAAAAYGFPDTVSMYRWIQVLQVFKGKTEIPMVDFDVPDGEAFVAGGLVTHNSKVGVLYGPTEDTAAGKAIKYYCSLRLRLNHGKSVKDGTQHVAKWVNIHPTKNHLGPQHRGTKILLNYTNGFDDARSTLMHAKEMQVVDPKCQSIKEARQCLGWEKDAATPDELIADVEAK